MTARTSLRSTIAACITAGMGFGVFSSITIQNDLSFFQPRSPSRISQLAIEQLKSGPASRLILLGLDGAPTRELAGLSRSLVERLSDSDSFVRIVNGANELDEGAFRFVFEHRYILGPEIDPSAFTADALRRSISEAVTQLSSFSGYAISDLLPSDPTRRSLALASAWQGKISPRYKHGVWFSHDGATALMIAETVAASDDQLRQAPAQAEIRQAFFDIAGTSSARLEMTGPSVISFAVSQSIQSEAWWIGIGAILIVIVTLACAFRSLVLHLVIALPTAMAAISGAAAVQALFGSVHGIALAFGATLVGVTSDYPVHLISHLRPGSSAWNAVRRIALPFGIGAGTTAAAFLPMTMSSYPGLSQLGLFAVVGIVAAALMTAFLLPWLLVSHEPMETIAPVERLLPPFTRAKIPLIVCGLAGLIWLGASGAAVFSEDLSRLSPVPARLVALDRALRAEIGAADVRRLLVIDGASAQEVLVASERVSSTLRDLAAAGVISSYEAPSDYLPSTASQRYRQSLLPADGALRKAVATAVRDVPVDAATFEPFIRDVTAAKSLAPIDPSDLMQVPLLGERLSSLLAQRDDGTWLGFVLFSGVSQPDQLVAALHKIGAPSIHYLDLQSEAIDLVASYRAESLKWLVGGSAIVLVILFAAVPVRRATRIIVSLIVSLSGTVAILVATGNSLSPFHIVSLLLVAGMGLDYALFVSLDDSQQGGLRRTLRSVIVCVVTTVAAFSLMVVSTAPILRGIGLTVAIGVTLAFVNALAICGDREGSAVVWSRSG